MTAATLRIGTRASRLAVAQAEAVRRALNEVDPGLQLAIHTITTEGDRELDRALPEIGGKGLFTLEIEAALRQGEIDLAVHSLKDLPTAEPEGLTLAAVPQRADPRDVLVAAEGQQLADLPPGATVGTSSPRRRAQLLALRPDLNLAWMRGNVETRIDKVRRGDYHAAVLAAAGLLRLERADDINQWFDPSEIMPAPGQGALAVQCRRDDSRTVTLLARIDDLEARAAVTAERSFLATLESGCSAPVGALGEAVEGGVELRAVVAAASEQATIRVSGRGADPASLGAQLAQQALAAGAAELVDAPA